MDAFLKEFVIAINYYGESFKFVDKRKLYHLLFTPSILNLFIAITVGYYAWLVASGIIMFLFYNFDINVKEGIVNKILELVALLFIRGMVLIVFLKLYRYLVLLLLSPLMLLISLKMHSIVTGHPIVFNGRESIHAIIRLYLKIFKNLFYEIVLSITVIALSILIIWISPLLPFILLIIESYFFSNSLLEFRNIAFRIDIDESEKLIGAHPGLILGNGIVFNIILLVPIFGVLIAPLWALISAGLAFDHIENKHYYAYTVHQSI